VEEAWNKKRVKVESSDTCVNTKDEMVPNSLPSAQRLNGIPEVAPTLTKKAKKKGKMSAVKEELEGAASQHVTTKSTSSTSLAETAEKVIKSGEMSAAPEEPKVAKSTEMVTTTTGTTAEKATNRKRKRCADETPGGNKEETPVPQRRKDEKREVMRINNQLKALGQRKQAAKAMELFEEKFGPLNGSGPLRPSVHSFTNLVNAFVRTCDVEKAQGIILAMKSRGFEPNVVTLTSLLKGFCEAGNMSEAEKLEHTIEGNERTLSTYLRGCLRWGTIDAALRRWRLVEGGACDDVSREYFAKICCIGLRVKAAKEVIAQMTTTPVPCLLSLAEAELLRGQPKKCRKLLNDVKEVVPTIDENLPKSMRSFLGHKQKEGERHRKFLKHALSSKVRAKALPLESSSSSTSSSHSAYDRFFYFRSNVASSTNSKTNPSIPWTARSVTRELRGIGLRKDALAVHEELKHACLQQGQLTLAPLDERPLKLEIGSGDGEWIVQHAQEDTSSLWAACELRYDRCSRIWSQMGLKGVDNMVILGGHAHNVVDLLKTGTVQEVVSFYPEPPAWHEGVWDAAAPHLWTHNFLNTLGEKMRSSGELRICSDNKKYLELIASYCPDFFSPATGDKIEVQKGRFDNSDTYFDRLWKQGRKRARFHLHLRRC